MHKEENPVAQWKWRLFYTGFRAAAAAAAQYDSKVWILLDMGRTQLLIFRPNASRT